MGLWAGPVQPGDMRHIDPTVPEAGSRDPVGKSGGGGSQCAQDISRPRPRGDSLAHAAAGASLPPIPPYPQKQPGSLEGLGPH